MLKAVTVNNPVSFTPSLWPLMGLRSSVHGTGLFPGFYLALFCKAPPAAFLAQRFLLSLSKENKNNEPLSVTRSLVAYPSCAPFSRSGRACSSHPRSSDRHIIFVPRNLSSPAEKFEYWQLPRIPSPSGSHQFRRASLRGFTFVRPLRPSALLASGSRVLSPRFSRLRARAPQVRFHGIAFRNSHLARSPSHFRQTESAQPFSAVSRPAFSRNVKAGNTWPKNAPGSLRPCRPPSPQTPHPPHTPQ